MEAKLPWTTDEAVYAAGRDNHGRPSTLGYRHLLVEGCEPEAVLCLMIVWQAVVDLRRPADPDLGTSPAEARRWLLQDGIPLLSALDLESYADRLAALVNGTPEPAGPQQLALEWGYE